MTIDIIGAGIGGLCTAVALEQKGIKTRIFEQAKEIKEVGAGIILANNAMQVLNRLGLQAIIEDNGNPISAINITRPNLEPLSKVELSFFEKKYNCKSIAIHRGKLQQILIDKLEYSKIQLNHRLSNIDRNTTGYNLNFENGIQIQSSNILGADGINSMVRKIVHPNAVIRNANQICWRGVTDYDLPSKFKSELNEAWGKSGRFGMVQISSNKVYWYALKSIDKNDTALPIDALPQYFGEFNKLVKEIIDATKTENINTSDISDLKPNNNWYKENICLLGDAAHAATPNMGQGACQAIEDAYVLSECLEKYRSNQAYKMFQNIRLEKAHHVVNTSWRIGKLAHLQNPILIGLRDLALRLSPASINRKQNEKIYELPSIN